MKNHHASQFFAALRLDWISRHLSLPWEKSLYVFINGFLSIAILSTAAWATGSPFVFPSLGPTAYLLYLNPLSEAASPRDSLLGHGIGILCGLKSPSVCSCCKRSPSIASRASLTLYGKELPLAPHRHHTRCDRV